MAFGKPPRAIRRPGVRLDNLILMPASLLPFKAEWQVANNLPRGNVLIVLASVHRPQWSSCQFVCPIG